MRIALIDPSLFTWPYDAELALALQSLGHEVAIFGKSLEPKDAGPAYPMLRPHFYRWLEPKPLKELPRAVFLGAKGLVHVRDMRTLLAALREYRPDVIHVQWAPLAIVDRFFVAALRKIAPTVLTVHDTVPYNGSPRSYLQRLSAISIMGKFDRQIVHTRKAEERLHEYGLSSSTVRRIPHGPMGVAPVLDSVEVPQKPAGAPLQILLFGRIKPYKGADVLVAAAAEMRRDLLEQVRIRIIGKPFMDLAPLQAAVDSAGIGAYVSIEPRFVAEAEVAHLLATTDIIALPYREIDASGVLMSCLSGGVPVIASRVGLFAEMIEDGKHGRLIEVGDHVGLARAIEGLVESPELRARMSVEVRKLRDGIPSWRAIAELTTDLYRELTGAHRAAPARDPAALRPEPEIEAEGG
jgi:glycosyltransferase involved in cell wall biosynthesis